MSAPHLSDDQLVEICFAADAAASSRAHLLMCAECETRRARLALTIDEAGDVIAAQADAAFPADRLTRQRARILQRIDAFRRPGRVITFPAAHAQPGSDTVALRPARWATVAAAVAAAFVIGILSEHLAHDLPGSRQSAPRVARQSAPAAAAVPIRAALSDDELLGQVELAAGRVGPAALRPLDALTPRPWDVR